LTLLSADDSAIDRAPQGGTVSLVSRASLAARRSQGENAIDARRFRMLFEIEGVQAHEEDDWIDREVRLGEATAVATLASGRSRWRITMLVAATAVLAVFGGSSWAGSQARASAAAAAGVTGDRGCDSLTTCYTPRQLEGAYGVLPLLEQGTDGRGETVVLPELAEPQFPLPTSDIRQDLAQFDKLFHLPAARVRVVSTLAP
jgi:hypothetical protein